MQAVLICISVGQETWGPDRRYRMTWRTDWGCMQGHVGDTSRECGVPWGTGCRCKVACGTDLGCTVELGTDWRCRYGRCGGQAGEAGRRAWGQTGGAQSDRGVGDRAGKTYRMAPSGGPTGGAETCGEQARDAQGLGGSARAPVHTPRKACTEAWGTGCRC